MKYEIISSGAPLAMSLEDGEAHFMGDGMVALLQRDLGAQRRKMQCVMVSRRDLEAIRRLDGASLTIPLEDGEAHHMGDGLFVVLQHDETRRGRPVNNVVLTANDAAALLAVAA